jgi:hypothetical protein
VRRSERLQSKAIPSMTEHTDDMDYSLGGDDFLADDGEYEPGDEMEEDDDIDLPTQGVIHRKSQLQVTICINFFTR